MSPALLAKASAIGVDLEPGQMTAALQPPSTRPSTRACAYSSKYSVLRHSPSTPSALFITASFQPVSSSSSLGLDPATIPTPA